MSNNTKPLKSFSAFTSNTPDKDPQLHGDVHITFKWGQSKNFPVAIEATHGKPGIKSKAETKELFLSRREVAELITILQTVLNA